MENRPQIQITTATLQDAKMLARLSASTFQATYQKDVDEQEAVNMQLYIEEEFTPEKIRQNLKNPKITYLLALQGTEILGYVKLVRDASVKGVSHGKVMNLEKIYIQTTFAGKGVGTSLMNKALTIAQQESIDTMWLCVWEINRKAVSFYEKFGFKHCGHYEFKMGKDTYHDLMMKKEFM